MINTNIHSLKEHPWQNNIKKVNACSWEMDIFILFCFIFIFIGLVSF